MELLLSVVRLHSMFGGKPSGMEATCDSRVPVETEVPPRLEYLCHGLDLVQVVQMSRPGKRWVEGGAEIELADLGSGLWQ
jgi:hypothetical protein